MPEDNGKPQLVGRNSFLATTERRYMEVKLDDFGMIQPQSLSAGEMAPYFQMAADPGRTSEKHAWIVCQCLVDENKMRIFRDEDIQRILLIDSGLLFQVAEACYLHCNNFGDIEKKVANLVANSLTGLPEAVVS